MKHISKDVVSLSSVSRTQFVNSGFVSSLHSLQTHVGHSLSFYSTTVWLLLSLHVGVNEEIWKVCAAGPKPFHSPFHSHRGSWKQNSVQLQCEVSGTEEFLNLISASLPCLDDKVFSQSITQTLAAIYDAIV